MIVKQKNVNVDIASMEKELTELLDSLKPYKFIFRRDGKYINKYTVVIKLNANRIVIIKPDNTEMPVENNGVILNQNDYTNIRTELQNSPREIKTLSCLDSAKQQILRYFINNGQLEDREEFLTAFSNFISKLPTISNRLQGYLSEIKQINFDDLDINLLDENDPNLKRLEELHKKILEELNDYRNRGEEYLVNTNRNYQDTQVTEDQDILSIPEPDFLVQYPQKSEKLKRIFEILNYFNIGNNPEELDKIANSLKVTEPEKLKSYFQATLMGSIKFDTAAINNNKTQVTNIISNTYWYSDDDMDKLGLRLEKYGVNVKTQFKNRLTLDVISALPRNKDLEEQKPIFISYNIGGSAEIEGGLHWVAIILVKYKEAVIVLYKDSKGDFNNNAEIVEAKFIEHYGSQIKFIKHQEIEQTDDSSCGPMTICNLEKIAANLQATHGDIDALINNFSSMTFAEQAEVTSIRNEHVKTIVELAESFNKLTINEEENNLKTVEEVIDELKLINKNGKSSIKEAIKKIDGSYNVAKKWELKGLVSWFKERKGKLDKEGSLDVIYEAIGIMERVNEIACGYRLRDTQKAAIFIFIRSIGKGHISQINTGEGKTTVVAFVQALKVLQGYKGHVITSNEVLASEGVESKKTFYDLLGITVAHNNHDKKYVNGPKACYNADIVYGSINNFQFDWLRDSFERLKTMNSLNFTNTWVMLDEIDSLLIDQGGNIAKLSGPYPGMESLRYVYINIWAALTKAEKEVEQEISEALKNKAMELNTKEGKLEESIAIEEYENFEDQLCEGFLDRIKNKIKDQKDILINKNIIAEHLHKYVEQSIERWIEYAFAAKYQYSENVEYKIVKNEDEEKIIIPMDNQNTGVSMKNTILSNGLHQFLQIKHNLCLTYESLTSSYISNLGYILNQYGNRLSGVTGTLGSDAERNLLGQVFNLEFSIMPTYKPKQFQAFPGKVISDDKFINEVALSALSEITRDRASLIVCASIRDVEEIIEELNKEAEKAGLTPNIKVYRDEAEVHVTKEMLDSGDIVIATNIAGRGTDFKTSDYLEQCGGLHVIEAFLPCNKRVEDQGFGRTSRQGNYGSGQIIARISEVKELGIIFDEHEVDYFEKIMQFRDQLESQRIADIKDNKVNELQFKDCLFSNFSRLYGKLKDKHKDESKYEDDPKWSYVLNDLKEKWAFWLEAQEYTAEKINKLGEVEQAAANEFAKFQEISLDITNGNIRHNPFYAICLAERYLEIGDTDNRKKAIAELENALNISKNSELLYSAHIKFFEIAIENGGQLLERYKKAIAKIFFISVDKDEHYKHNALFHLNKAKAALKKECNYLEQLLIGARDQPEGSPSVIESILIQSSSEQAEDNIFVKHLQARQIVLGVYLGNIGSLIEQINGPDALREGIIIGTKVPRYLVKLNPKLEHEKQLQEKITELEVNELEHVGMNSVMQLREVHDVPEEVITNAQWQIGAGLATLAITIPFPFLLPVNGQIAGALISEGITDIVMALIDQGQDGFNRNDYIKSKLISYGISIVTMGIATIASSTKILTKAMNACKSLANKLRAVKGPFSRVCNWMATKLDKLANYFELCIKKIEMAKKSMDAQKQILSELHKEASAAKMASDVAKYNKLTQQLTQLSKLQKVSDVVMTHSQKLMQALKATTVSALKGVAVSVAMEKIVTATLNNIMTGLKPEIEKKIKETVATKINNEKSRLSKYSQDTIDNQIQAVFLTNLSEDIEHVAKEISFGILRHSNNWKMQLVTLAVETILSGIDITTCTNKICTKFFTGLPAEEQASHQSNYEHIIEQISVGISNLVYSKIVAITGKVVVTFPKILYRGYKQHKEKIQDKQKVKLIQERIEEVNAAEKSAIQEKTDCGHNAVATSLGIDNEQLAHSSGLAMSTKGASKEDIKALYSQNGIETTECSVGDAIKTLESFYSDRAIVCLKQAGQEMGHAISVTLENGQFVVTESGQKKTLTAYCQESGYSADATVIVPHNINAEYISDGSLHRNINYNRVAKLAHPIDFVGKIEGKKFGKPHGLSDEKWAKFLVKRDAQQDVAKRGKKVIEADDVLKDAIKRGATQEEINDLRSKLDDAKKKLNVAEVHKKELDENGKALDMAIIKKTKDIKLHLQPTTSSIGKDLEQVNNKQQYREEAIGQLIPTFVDQNGYKITSQNNTAGTMHQTEKLRIDYQGEFREGSIRYANIQLQIGGIKYKHKRTAHESTTIAHIEIEKPTSGEYHYTKSAIEHALRHSLENNCIVRLQKTPQSTSKSKKGLIDQINNKFRKSEIDYWFDYTENGLKDLLELRLSRFHEFDNNTMVLNPIDFCIPELSSLIDSLNVIEYIFKNDNKIENILIPIVIAGSKEACHWVGIALKKRENNVEINYLDSENMPIMGNLKCELIRSIQQLNPEFQVLFKRFPVEQQRYNNCGPELVENFIYYLTGNRVTQESAVYKHSMLFEEVLLFSNISYKKSESKAVYLTENEEKQLVMSFSNKLRV